MQCNIIRPNQLALINEGIKHPLTLLVAAAGSGKSTLVKQWQKNNAHILTLNIKISPRLTEGQLLFKKLLTELRNIVPLWDASIFNLFKNESPVNTKVLIETLIFAFNSIDKKLVIIFDDFHIIQSAESQNIFYSLINNTPRNVQFIISSRRYPSFSISNMKLKEKIFIIDGSDLKLTSDEVVSLNTNLGSAPLSEERLKILIQQTQGWVVGVKLALLAYRKSGDRALDNFSGTQPDMLNYFCYEVLINLPKIYQDFVLRTAIFESFNSDACLRVLNIENSESILDGLSSQELLLVKDRNTKNYFRYHPLFHEFLQQQLALKSEKIYIENIHKNASEYFLKEDKNHLALNHANQTADQKYFTVVLRYCCERWLRDGHFEKIIESITPLEDDQVRQDYSLLVSVTYALIFTRRFNQAHYYLDFLKLQDTSASLQDKVGRHTKLTHSDFIEHMLLFLQKEDTAFTEQGIALLATQHPEPDIRALSTLIVAYGHMYHGQFYESFQLAHKVKALVKQTRYRFLESCADLLIVLSDRYLCQGSEAIQKMITAYNNAPKEENSPVWVNLATGMMVVHYEQNKLTLALEFCEKLLPAVNHTCATEVIANVYLLLSRIWHIKGETQKAEKLLVQLERILMLGNYSRFQSLITQEQMRQAIEDGLHDRTDEIYHENKLHLFLRTSVFRKPNIYEESRERYALTSVYWLTHNGQFSAAEKILIQLITALDALDIKFRALISRCNLLVVYSASGEHNKALIQLKVLLKKYGYACFSRSIFDETPGLKALFEEAVQTNIIQPPKAYLELFGNYLIDTQGQDNSVTPEIILTAKELNIFKLLGGGLSNAEISHKAGIAVSTTKWHLKNIYSKLELANRSAAVMLANQSSQVYE